jgi:hypothetical protein
MRDERRVHEAESIGGRTPRGKDKMRSNQQEETAVNSVDRLEAFGIYNLACQLFDSFWSDSESPVTRHSS